MHRNDTEYSSLPWLSSDANLNNANMQGSKNNGTDFANNQKEEEALSSDPWALPEFQMVAMDWHAMTWKQKLKKILIDYIGKMVILIILLYLFICSLDLLSSSFKLLGGKTAGKVFTESKLLNNSVAGLMIGVLATVLLQSSSTTTSIIVTMVASGILTVKPAIPIIMGANIGTSVTNTIVSLASATKINNGISESNGKASKTNNKPDASKADSFEFINSKGKNRNENNEFRRAFAAATIHDMFNWLTVCVLLPLESLTGLLYHLTFAIVSQINFQQLAGESNKVNNANNKEILSSLTKPFTSLFIELNKNVITLIAEGKMNETANMSLVKRWCLKKGAAGNSNMTTQLNISLNGSQPVNNILVKCKFLFAYVNWSDGVIGTILLIISLFMLTLCLLCIVKVLHSMLKGKIALGIRKVVNADIPKPFTFLTGYFAILIGAICTFLLQSSSVFTSALTPLVAIGVISLDRVYPLTLGSNLGTTATGLIASLTASPLTLKYSLQIALCHTFFNILGILFWYPVPALRFPLALAKIMGATTAKYTWFAVFYLVVAFFVLPGSVFALSTLTTALLPVGGDRVSSALIFATTGFLAIGILFATIVTKLQQKRPTCLPIFLRDWSFLPACLRSLEPLDQLFSARRLRELLKRKSKSKDAAHILTNSTYNSTNALIKNASFPANKINNSLSSSMVSFNYLGVKNGGFIAATNGGLNEETSNNMPETAFGHLIKSDTTVSRI
ncbi:sodium-dependent phosphate transport protein 2A-like isoform X2 [Gordionus sp. m RMFG-2023]